MTTKRKKTQKKIWYISRFRDRYELAENIRYDRKSPLLYTKDFVGSGNDDESCAYFRQLMALRSKSNWLELRGAFAELKNIAGNMSKVFRGYLLNSDFKPATIKEIGRWLGKNEAEAKVIMDELKDVGLLEEIDLPAFDTDGNESPKKSKKKSSSRKKKLKKKTSSHKKPVRARGRTGNSGGAQNSLKKKAKAKAKAKVKNKANVNANNVNDKSPREINNNRIHKSNALEENKADEAAAKCSDAALAPTTTPPLEPTKSDEGGAVIQFPAPSGSANHGPLHLGSVAKSMVHRYDQDAKDFAGEIYQALNLHRRWCPTSSSGRRELGSFASVWMKAKTSGLPPPELAQLWSRAIQEAQQIAKKLKSGKPSAVWCSVFNKILDKRCSENQCKAM